MQFKTFVGWSAVIGPLGAGALTQSPEYSFLALPVAIASGVLWILIAAIYLYRNRKNPAVQIVLLVCVCTLSTIWLSWQASGRDWKVATALFNLPALVHAAVPATRPADEKLPGFGSGMIVQTGDVQEVRRKFQYAFRARDGAKVAFYLSASNRYAFSVTDINGEEYKLDIPLGYNGLPFGKWAYIFCEVGSASSYSYLRAMLNGKEVARRDFDFPLDLGSRKWMPVLGADADGKNGGAFSTDRKSVV